MINEVDHIGIAVRSIAAARGFYEAMGLSVAHIEEVPDDGVRVAMIPCGSSRIELLEPTSPDSPVAKFLDKQGPGMHHLCLRSSDVQGDDERLREAGVKLVRDTPSRGAEGSRVQFVHPRSSGGVLVELSEPAK